MSKNPKVWPSHVHKARRARQLARWRRRQRRLGVAPIGDMPRRHGFTRLRVRHEASQ